MSESKDKAYELGKAVARLHPCPYPWREAAERLSFFDGLRAGVEHLLETEYKRPIEHAHSTGEVQDLKAPWPPRKPARVGQADVLPARRDTSPFLVHLTRPFGGYSAFHRLRMILDDKKLSLHGEESLVSDARFVFERTLREHLESEKPHMWSAVCFSETPLSEIHTLFDLAGRDKHLQPYGLVFVRDRLAESQAAPVYYVNNKTNDKHALVNWLCQLGLQNEYEDELSAFLPLISVFGEKLKPPIGKEPQPVENEKDGSKNSDGEDNVDFRWEREWRLPAKHCPLKITKDNTFIGLCAHEYIDYFRTRSRKLFEGEDGNLDFIDPRHNLRFYAREIREAIERTGIPYDTEYQWT